MRVWRLVYLLKKKLNNVFYLSILRILVANENDFSADIAQLVEQLTCNQ